MKRLISRLLKLILPGSLAVTVYLTFWNLHSAALTLNKDPETSVRRLETDVRTLPRTKDGLQAAEDGLRADHKVVVVPPHSNTIPKQGPVTSAGRNQEATCRPPYHPQDELPPDDWQKVEAGQHLSYAFSAYLDSRLKLPVVKIFGIRSRRAPTPTGMRCRIWTRESNEPHVVQASVTGLPDMNKHTCHVVRWSCSIDNSSTPYAVQLVTTASASGCQQEPVNTFYVRNVEPKEREKRENKFTICVPTMYKNYNNVAELVEMIEVNRMFGADKIVLYNYSTGHDIQPYMRSYEKEGVVDVIQWPLPDELVHPPGVHNHGLMAVVNECMYRYMYKSTYVIGADLDELIVPRKLEHSTWSEMVSKYVTDTGPGRPPIQGALNFRCTFFRKEMKDSETMQNATIKDLALRSLLHVKREVKIWPARSRTKFLVPPELVDVCGVHFIHRFVGSTIQQFGSKVALKGSMGNVDVPVEHALMHHYRSWKDPPSGFPPVEEDRFMHRYREEIVSRVLRRHHVVTEF